MEVGTVRQIDINVEMQGAYLDYAMSVIVARALPDVRDGLKPVHRRILYAMYDMGLFPDRPYRKSARIVGEVLGKYHPHGDAAVYESMVRMAQDFSMRYPLVDGQGNFGSVDGDEPAAMRYTEARLNPIAMEMLADIDKETVAFGANFDGTLQEPLVLPSALPNFLVNGASGIAVGMATNVPPHNLGEVCDALCYMIEHYAGVDDITIEELMQFIRGPDFPTGGIVFRYGEGDEDGKVDLLKAAYAVGRGRFTIRARAHIEEMSRNRSRIVVTELPYQVNKARLMERIAELAREGRLEGLVDLRDESDRQGMRVVIELTRTVDPKEVLSKLFKLTPMQVTFGVNILALVDGEPRTLSLKRALWHYLEHRQVIVTRRSQYELERARRQAHILEGLLIALDNLDAVIDTIRRSRDADTAKTNLIRKFRLTELQAQAILDMPLRRLASLEQRKIRDEYQEKLALIAYLEDLLRDPHKILLVIREELQTLKRKYGDARRTLLVDRAADLVTARDVIEEQDVIIALGRDKIWQEPLAGHRRGSVPGSMREGLLTAVLAKSTGDVGLFTAKGQGVLIPVHQVPVGVEVACTLGELLNMNMTDTPVLAVTVPAEKLKRVADADDTAAAESPAGFLVLASAQGKVKRVALSDFCAVAGRGLTTVMGIEAPDRLVGALLAEGNEDVVLISSAGQAIRFDQNDVRPMGLPAAGVAGIKLGNGEEVVGLGLARPKGELVLITEQGYAKRTPLEAFPRQGRYGAGVVAMKVTKRTGAVVGGAVATADDELVLVTAKGKVSSATPAQVAALGRSAQGKPFMKLAAHDRVAGLTVLDYRSALKAAAPTLSAEMKPAQKTRPSRKSSEEKESAGVQLAFDVPANGSAAKSPRRRKAGSEETPKPSAGRSKPAKPATTKRTWE